MAKTFEQQRADLRAKIEKLEAAEQAATTKAHDKFMQNFAKLADTAARASGANLAELDMLRLKESLRKLFADLATPISAKTPKAKRVADGLGQEAAP